MIDPLSTARLARARGDTSLAILRQTQWEAKQLRNLKVAQVALHAAMNHIEETRLLHCIIRGF